MLFLDNGLYILNLTNWINLLSFNKVVYYHSQTHPTPLFRWIRNLGLQVSDNYGTIKITLSLKSCNYLQWCYYLFSLFTSWVLCDAAMKTVVVEAVGQIVRQNHQTPPNCWGILPCLVWGQNFHYCHHQHLQTIWNLKGEIWEWRHTRKVKGCVVYTTSWVILSYLCRWGA